MENKQLKSDNEDLQNKITDFIDKDEMLQVEEMLVNNCIEFTCNKKQYRLKKPNIKHRQIVERALFKLTNELMSDGFLTEEKWKIKLKETQGIDLDDFNNKIQDITKQIEAKYEILAPAANEDARKKLIFEIEQLKTERSIAHIELTNHRAPCIDSQVLNKSVYLYTWLLTEVKDGDTWHKVWDKFEDFEDYDSQSEENEVLVVEAVKIAMKYIF